MPAGLWILFTLVWSCEESHVVKFYMRVFGNTLYSDMNFMERLTERLHLVRASSEEDGDLIIAFVCIASRAGTDIHDAVQRIPETTRPVVLVVLHHTFDPYFVAPDSNLGVTRTDMFIVDCLFHEDQGLLRCEHNDQALKAVTDHLISKGASPAPLPYDDLAWRLMVDQSVSLGCFSWFWLICSPYSP